MPEAGYVENGSRPSFASQLRSLPERLSETWRSLGRRRTVAGLSGQHVFLVGFGSMFLLAVFMGVLEPLLIKSRTGKTPQKLPFVGSSVAKEGAFLRIGANGQVRPD